MNGDLDVRDVPIEELQHSDCNVRGRAALALGALGDGRVGEALIRALCAERDPFVRENLTWALARLGPGVVPPLTSLLGHADPSCRHRAAHALSKIADPRAVDALIAALDDQDSTVIAKAAFALGQLGDPRAIPALSRLLGHESKDVESTLASVLERFGPAAAVHVGDRLASESWRAREQAAYILGALAHAGSVDSLFAALHDARWQVRFASLFALAGAGRAHAARAAKLLKEDADTRVRALAHKTLGLK